MKLVKILAIFGLASSAYAGGPSNCEALKDNFAAFQNIWQNHVNEIQFFTMNSSSVYPILKPAFIVDLICEMNFAIILAANVTNRLTGVDSNIILSIINGTVAQPFQSPLDCIADDLIFMHNQISTVFNTVIPQMRASIIPVSNIPTDCLNIFAYAFPYAVTFIRLLISKGVSITANALAYGSINMQDLFLNNFIGLTCYWDIIAAGIGAILNTDSEAILAYLKGETTTISYPFDCIQTPIDVLKNAMAQAINAFMSGSPLRLNIPPNFL